MKPQDRAFKKPYFYYSTTIMKTFITGLKSEFEKIVWPSAGEAFGLAAIVIAIAILVGYYLGLFDAIFAGILKAIIG